VRSTLNRNSRESDDQTHTEHSQQDAPNPAIPAVSAGPATPLPLLNASFLRLIQQLLPAFGDWSP